MSRRESLSPEVLAGIAVQAASIYHAEPSLVELLRSAIARHKLPAVNRALRQLKAERAIALSKRKGLQ